MAIFITVIITAIMVVLFLVAIGGMIEIKRTLEDILKLYDILNVEVEQLKKTKKDL